MEKLDPHFIMPRESMSVRKGKPRMERGVTVEAQSSATIRGCSIVDADGPAVQIDQI